MPLPRSKKIGRVLLLSPVAIFLIVGALYVLFQIIVSFYVEVLMDTSPAVETNIAMEIPPAVNADFAGDCVLGLPKAGVIGYVKAVLFLIILADIAWFFFALWFGIYFLYKSEVPKNV